MQGNWSNSFALHNQDRVLPEVKKQRQVQVRNLLTDYFKSDRDPDWREVREAARAGVADNHVHVLDLLGQLNSTEQPHELETEVAQHSNLVADDEADVDMARQVDEPHFVRRSQFVDDCAMDDDGDDGDENDEGTEGGEADNVDEDENEGDDVQADDEDEVENGCDGDGSEGDDVEADDDEDEVESEGDDEDEVYNSCDGYGSEGEDYEGYGSKGSEGEGSEADCNGDYLDERKPKVDSEGGGRLSAASTSDGDMSQSSDVDADLDAFPSQPPLDVDSDAFPSLPPSGVDPTAGPQLLPDNGHFYHLPVASITTRFETFLKAALTCELVLTETVQLDLCKCLNTDCDGELQPATDADLKQLNQRPKSGTVLSSAPKVLVCNKCAGTFDHKSVLVRALKQEARNASMQDVPDFTMERLRQHCSGDSCLPAMENQALREFQAATFLCPERHIRAPRQSHPPTVCPRDEDPAVHRVHMARVQEDQMGHDPQHRTACWNKQGNCRYNVPHKVVSATMIELERGEGELIQGILVFYQRRAPYLFLSASSTALMQMICMNQFTRYVLNAKLTYYCSAYHHKDQITDIEAAERMMSRLTLYRARLEADIAKNPDGLTASRSAHSKGLGLMMSSVMNYSNAMTLPATMGSYFNVGGMRFEQSYPSVVCYVIRAMQALNDEEVNGKIHPKTRTHDDGVQDYHCRGVEDAGIAAMGLVEFCRCYERLSIKTVLESEVPYHSFSNDHTMHSTHCFVQRKHKVVLRLAAPGMLPNRNKVMVSDDTEGVNWDEVNGLRDRYALQVLAMFAPHKYPWDLRVYDNEPWWHVYKRLLGSLPSDDPRQRMLLNIQQFHESFMADSVELGMEDEDVVEQMRTDLGEVIPDPDLLAPDDEDLSEVPVPGVSDATILLVGASRVQVEHKQHEVAGIRARAAAPSRYREFKDAIAAQPTGTDEEHVYYLHPKVVINPDTPGLSKAGWTRPAVVEMLCELRKATFELRRIKPEPQNEGAGDIQPNTTRFPTIQAHLKHWRLNKLQWYAGTLLCLAILDGMDKLLRRVGSDFEEPLTEDEMGLTRIHEIIDRLNGHVYKTRSELEPDGRTDLDPDCPLLQEFRNTRTLRLYTMGKAGVGKSHLLHTVRDFALAWLFPMLCILTAHSGCAAALLQGVTWWRAMGLSPQNIFNVYRPGPKEDHRKQFNQVFLFIVDEAGMLSGHQLLELEKQSRKLKQQLVPFGGMSMGLMFDLRQPTSLGALYKAGSNLVGPDAMGKTLYQVAPNGGIELQEIKRQEEDWWEAITSRCATNEMTYEDLKWINENMWLKPGGKWPLSSNARIGLGGNQVALEVNNLYGRQFCEDHPVDVLHPGKWTDRGFLLVVSDVDILGQNKEDTKSLKRQVLRMPYRQTQDVSAMLMCILGHGYRVTHNKAGVEHGMANGCVLTLSEVIISPENEAHISFHASPGVWGNGYHVINAKYVEGVVLRHTLKGWNDYIYPVEALGDTDVFGASSAGSESILHPSASIARVFPPGEVLLKPVKVSRRNWKVRDRRKYVNFDVFGFLLVPAFACTFESQQGFTFPQSVIADLGKYMNNSNGVVYMVLTRTKLSSQTKLMFQFPLKVSFFAVRWQLKAELYRLQKMLCDRTYHVLHDLCDNPEYPEDQEVHTSPYECTPAQYAEHRHLLHNNFLQAKATQSVPSEVLQGSVLTHTLVLGPEAFRQVREKKKTMVVRVYFKATTLIKQGDYLHFKWKGLNAKRNNYQYGGLGDTKDPGLHLLVRVDRVYTNAMDITDMVKAHGLGGLLPGLPGMKLCEVNAHFRKRIYPGMDKYPLVGFAVTVACVVPIKGPDGSAPAAPSADAISPQKPSPAVGSNQFTPSRSTTPASVGYKTLTPLAWTPSKEDAWWAALTPSKWTRTQTSIPAEPATPIAKRLPLQLVALDHPLRTELDQPAPEYVAMTPGDLVMWKKYLTFCQQQPGDRKVPGVMLGELRYEDMARLKPKEFTTSQLLNEYLTHLQEYNRLLNKGVCSVWCCDTFTLLQVAKWSTKCERTKTYVRKPLYGEELGAESLVGVRAVLLPVHVHMNHWLLLVFILDAKDGEPSTIFFDSMGHKSVRSFDWEVIVRHMREYLRFEYTFVHPEGTPVPAALREATEVHWASKGFSLQRKVDCGIYLLRYCLDFTLGHAWDSRHFMYDAAHMEEEWRLRILADVRNRSIHYTLMKSTLEAKTPECQILASIVVSNYHGDSGKRAREAREDVQRTRHGRNRVVGGPTKEPQVQGTDSSKKKESIPAVAATALLVGPVVASASVGLSSTSTQAARAAVGVALLGGVAGASASAFASSATSSQVQVARASAPVGLPTIAMAIQPVATTLTEAARQGPDVVAATALLVGPVVASASVVVRTNIKAVSVSDPNVWRGWATVGDGDCGFHAAFGTWQQQQQGCITDMMYFASDHVRMRDNFVKFVCFFGSLDEMEATTTRKYALNSLGDFYAGGRFLNNTGFQPSNELSQELENMTAASQAALIDTRQAKAAIRACTRDHVAKGGAGAPAIIKLVGQDVLSCTKSGSRMYPLAEAMRGMFSQVSTVEMEMKKQNDPGAHYDAVVGHERSKLFWDKVLEWEGNNSQRQRVVDDIIDLHVDLVRQLLASCDVQTVMPEAQNQQAYYEDDPILQLPLLWQEFTRFVASKGSYYYLSVGDMGLVSEISRRGIEICFSGDAITPTVQYIPSKDKIGLYRTRDGVRECFEVERKAFQPGSYPDEVCYVAHTGQAHYERFGPPPLLKRGGSCRDLEWGIAA